MAAPTYQTAVTLQSFNWLAVTTIADTVVTCGFEDIAILHTGSQADDITSPTASVATDYLVVTDASDSTNPTDDRDPGDASGSKSHKMIVPQGKSRTWRGADMQWNGTSRKFNIRAVGSTAFVQLVRGSGWGTMP